jgi:RNA polymerase sigma-70 factor, ECF subfamily
MNSPTPGLSESVFGASFGGSDAETWLSALQSGGRARAEAVFRLRSLLVAAARFEASRRPRDMTDLGDEELDDIVSKAADEALDSVLNSLKKCDGKRRFTTWACKFAVAEVSARLRRRAWQGRTLPSEGECWSFAAKHGDAQKLNQLRRVAEEMLGDGERQALFLTLGNVPIDVIADRLGTTRGTVYHTLQRAHKKLSAGRLDSEGAS